VTKTLRAGLNAESSRSHLIIALCLESVSDGVTRVSKLYLVVGTAVHSNRLVTMTTLAVINAVFFHVYVY
jgi:hypothetical protein